MRISQFKRLVAAVLGIPADSISEFRITNPEIPPGSLGDKFCRLNINRVVDGRRVTLAEVEGRSPAGRGVSVGGLGASPPVTILWV
jgi:hypothetical protein